MKTIDITAVLGSELKSRTSARDFAKYLQNMKIYEAQIDFAHVRSVTRSFMDEFYYLMMRDGNAQRVRLNLINTGLQEEEFLKAVKLTSVTPRRMSEPSDARFLNPSTVKQLNEYLAAL